LPKNKKSDVFDKVLDSVKTVFEKAGPRDFIYCLAYLAAVYQCYYIFVATKKTVEKLPWWSWISGLAMAIGIATVGGEASKEAKETELDWDSLTLAMVAGYMVLKIDLDDVKGALSAVTAVVGKLSA
jgi:hypothetical protein